MAKRTTHKFKIVCEACRKARWVQHSVLRRRPRFCGRACYGNGRKMGIVKRGDRGFGAHKIAAKSHYQALAGLDDDSLDKKLRESFLKAHPVLTYRAMSDEKKGELRRLYETCGTRYLIIAFATGAAVMMIEAAIGTLKE